MVFFLRMSDREVKACYWYHAGACNTEGFTGTFATNAREKGQRKRKGERKKKRRQRKR